MVQSHPCCQLHHPSIKCRMRAGCCIRLCFRALACYSSTLWRHHYTLSEFKSDQINASHDPTFSSNTGIRTPDNWMRTNRDNPFTILPYISVLRAGTAPALSAFQTDVLTNSTILAFVLPKGFEPSPKSLKTICPSDRRQQHLVYVICVIYHTYHVRVKVLPGEINNC